MGHLLRSLYRGPLGRKKLPLALPGAFSLAKLSGSPYLGVAASEIRISEKTPAPPGSRVFLLGLHGRLLSAGDRQSLPQKLVACKAMASSCGIARKMLGDARVAYHVKSVKRQGEASNSSLMASGTSQAGA